MINAAKISEAVKRSLMNSTSVQEIAPIIERSSYVNMDPNKTPWIGVYRTGVNYSPKTLGRSSRSWQGVIHIALVVQEASLKSGEDCEDKLESLIEEVISALWATSTFSGTVETVTAFSVNYLYEETDEESMFFQSAKIDMELEVRTG